MEHTEENKNIPRSVGIIMDGNRRWAKAKGLPTFEGHRVGYDKLTAVVNWCQKAGIGALTIYAFSTENWERTALEVGFLMNLFRTAIGKLVVDAQKTNTRLLFFGERTRLAPDICNALQSAEHVTGKNNSFTLGIALSYGGRAEILDAIHRIPKEQLATISEAAFSSLLWSHEIPDLDLIIRTSGEERLSNFLPWQSVYSELFFTETLWPDFTREEFMRILGEYAGRERRHGK